MKAELYRNIDIVQLNIAAGTDEWTIPQNVAWADKVVDKIVIYAPTSLNCVSPIDGVTHVFAASEISDLFCDVYDSGENEVLHNLHYSNLLYSNNHALPFGRKLSTQLTRFYRTSPVESAGCILLYIFYETKHTDCYEESRRNKCITFELEAGEQMTFGDICRRWLHADGKAVRGLWFVNPEANPAYLTLRDHELTYMMHYISNELMRGQAAKSTAEQCQLHPFLMDSLDIDFEYSNILNATGTKQTHTIVIEY